MSFIKVEAVRSIKLHDKTYRSAHQAAVAYARSATNQLYWTFHNRGNPISPMPKALADDRWWAINQRFYRRSHKIFTRYFSGKP